MTVRPQARFQGLVAEQLNDGSKIHDTETGRSHRLDWLTTQVWTLADGRRTLAEIAELANARAGAVAEAVKTLADLGLLSEAVAVDGDGTAAEASENGVQHGAARASDTADDRSAQRRA
jgi:hypothetical protein